MIIPTTLRNILRSSKLIRCLYYNWHLADIPVMLGIGGFSAHTITAMKLMLNAAELQDERIMSELARDIRQCYYRYKTTPMEYFLFEFRNKDKRERESYISDAFIMKYAADKSGRKIHDIELNNKFRFYQLNKPFFKRLVMLFNSDTTIGDFMHFSKHTNKIIAKPNASALGAGVRVFHLDSDSDIKSTFGQLKETGISYVIEEFIQQHENMALWNSSSVNTVRVNSFLSKGNFNILCPFIRTGRKGSIVDNGGQGGIFASIDKETGTVCTDGMDEKLNTYSIHPDSKIAYKGWKIPYWKDLMELTERCHRNMHKHAYVSWDFALTATGWVLIEGNWGEFVAQQVTNKRGFKEEFLRYLNP